MAQGKALGVSESMPNITYSTYTAHASGATTVTSNAATDLDTTAAALATLSTAFNTLLTQLRTAGYLDT